MQYTSLADQIFMGNGFKKGLQQYSRSMSMFGKINERTLIKRQNRNKKNNVEKYNSTPGISAVIVQMGMDEHFVGVLSIKKR